MSVDINISNYESFLYSYVDGELNAEETAAMERFLEANPALHSELDLLLATRLQPEPVVFENKAALYRTNDNEINLKNYEGHLLSYIDGELNKEEVTALEHFMGLHPKVRQELVMWQATKQHADPAIRFENKAVLYRHPNARKMRPAYWWAASAAAVVAGLLVFFQLNDQQVVDQPAAKLAGTTQQPVNVTPQAVQPPQNTAATQSADQQAATNTTSQQTAAAINNTIAPVKPVKQIAVREEQAVAQQKPANIQQENIDISSLEPGKTTAAVIDRQQLEAALNTPPKQVAGTVNVTAARPSLDPETPPSALATQAPAGEPGELIMSVTGNGIESRMLNKVTNVARFFAKKKKQ